jgi:hypothetical protein
MPSGRSDRIDYRTIRTDDPNLAVATHRDLSLPAAEADGKNFAVHYPIERIQRVVVPPRKCTLLREVEECFITINVEDRGTGRSIGVSSRRQNLRIRLDQTQPI